MKFTFLQKEEIWGDKALQVMKDYGARAGYSDLVMILGGMNSGGTAMTCEGHPTGCWWSASQDSSDDVHAVDYDGNMRWYYPYLRKIAARPALPSSAASLIRPSAQSKIKLNNGNTVTVVEHGEYPQTVASDKVRTELEKQFQQNRLVSTGKKYTFDSVALDDKNRAFQPKKCLEYAYQGKRYIRIEGKPADKDSILSTGERVESGKAYWVEVEPIKWLKDRSGTLISKALLFAGVQFDCSETYSGDFEKTNINEYLQKYFAQEILPTRSNEQTAEISQTEEEPRKTKGRANRYGLKVVERPMSAEAQINFYIQNGLSFMLHGPSGIGKSRRVQDSDPNLTTLTLWNGILPEEVVGKTIYPDGTFSIPSLNTDGAPEKSGGYWVPPEWYVDICKKCTQEPNKKHVLFIDEVTNAKATTQSMIFHIVLQRSIAANKGVLPSNAVVVMAGNSKEESSAAYNMPEPLFRRSCGHIYLEPNIPDWLEWASKKSPQHQEEDRLNVHPLISSFVANYGLDVFYTSYDEEKPKEWAMDPRGWEQVSDIIYNNKGEIRMELLENKIGPDLAASLFEYAKNPPLALEDVLEGSYTRADIPDLRTARLSLALNMRYVDEKHVQEVREFVGSNLGKETLAVFDNVWAGKNDERALQIASLQKMSNGR